MRTHAQNVAVGRAKKQAGDAFEMWIEYQHQRAMCDGVLACVVHNQPESRFVNGRVIYTERGVADYTGTFNDGYGTTLAVEAKSTKDGRIYKDIVSRKQQEHLDAVTKAGGVALLLVEDRRYMRRYAVYWKQVPWQVLRSAESLDCESLKHWLVSEECYLFRFCIRGERQEKAKNEGWFVKKRVIHRQGD